MDPEETLKRLASYIRQSNFSDAVGALNSYYVWRVRGGFAPLDGDSRADLLAVTLQDAIDDARLEASDELP
jgi:hypothetical protein